MVAIKGKIIKHFYCLKHAENNNLDEPTLAVVKLRPTSLSFNRKDSHHCNHKLDTEYLREIPIIDICYELETNSLLEELIAGDLVEIEIRNKSFYYLPHKLVGIREVENGQIKFWNLEVRDGVSWDLGKQSRVVSKVQRLSSLKDSYPRRWVKSTKEFVSKLVKLPEVATYQLPVDLITVEAKEMEPV